MRIALLADIHGNREALTACLDTAARYGADRYVILGDIVGYGADPAFTVETVAALAEKGAVVLQGNHDAAAVKTDEELGSLAQRAIEWTRTQLSDDHKAFLAGLPIEHADEDRLYVHASAAAPSSWIYLASEREAERCLRATQQRLVFCGHTHVPALYHATQMTAASRHVPKTGKAIPMLAPRRWIAVLGAVGQPRDGDPAACFGLFDDSGPSLMFVRVPYDVTAAAGKIRAAGLPEELAARLIRGR
jgi:diadenosine tetraphosphatase ApaH/serine/threonine PP2A family protein phosphatase